MLFRVFSDLLHLSATCGASFSCLLTAILKLNNNNILRLVRVAAALPAWHSSPFKSKHVVCDERHGLASCTEWQPGMAGHHKSFRPSVHADCDKIFVHICLFPSDSVSNHASSLRILAVRGMSSGKILPAIRPACLVALSDFPK